MKELFYKMIKPSIIFESMPDFSDNSRAVFDEMVRQGYDKKYRLIWFIRYGQCASIKNGKVEYWDHRDRKTLLQKIRNYSFHYKTKCIICCNHFITSSGKGSITSGKDQKSFYLSHGTPMKRVKPYYTSHGGIDYILSPAKALDGLMAEEFSFDRRQVFTCGFPRNDAFARPAPNLRQLLGINHKRIIIWYPTYRQNADKTIVATKNSLPIIHDEESAKQLNEAAKKLDVFLILKPHHAQDVSLIHDLHLSNIRLISDNFFAEKGISSYELLAGSDALITDYSSVYFDYTLCDKPIGVIWEDIDEYRSFPGFAMDLDYYLKGAVKIYNRDDFAAFLQEVAEGKDRLQVERREIRDVTNYSTDGKNAERVVAFIAEKAGL